MASFTDTISLVFKAVTGQATAEIGKVDQSLEKAGKSTEGFGGQMNRLGAIAGPAVATAGLAVAAWGIKATKAFQDSAIAASDLADATGLTTEQASRWREVAKDAGVDTGALGSAFNKMNRAAAGGALKELGINAQGANDQLLAVMQYLNGITDEGKKAAEGTRLLGKGWQSLAPLIADSADARQRLADVSKDQVFDEKEVARAKELRDVTDQISDAYTQAQMKAGSYFAGVIAGLDGLKKVGTDLVTDDKGGPSAFGRAWGFAANNVKLALKPVTDLATALPELADHLSEQEAASKKSADGLRSLRAAGVETSKAQDALSGAVKDTAITMEDVNKEYKDYLRALEDVASAQGDAVGTQIAYNRSVRDAGAAIDDAKAALKDHGRASEEATKANEDLYSSVVDVGEAAAKNAQVQATARGATLSAKQAIDVQIQALSQLKAKYPELGPIIDGHIGKLKSVPTAVSTKMSVDATGGIVGASGKHYPDASSWIKDITHVSPIAIDVIADIHFVDRNGRPIRNAGGKLGNIAF